MPLSKHLPRYLLFVPLPSIPCSPRKHEKQKLTSTRSIAMDHTTTATPTEARTTILVQAGDTRATIRLLAVGMGMGVILRQGRSEDAS